MIAVLTATGDITDERRQEFILWSDALGLSMLVDALAHELPAGATESTVLGPFYVPGSPRARVRREHGRRGGRRACRPGSTAACSTPSGAPIAGAELDVWQNGADMLYAVQRPEAEEDHLRGRYLTRDDGTYAFVAVRPVPYPIPDDGPVGRMLSATGRHPWRPAHIHMIVRAPGHKTVTTHVFDATSEYLDSDTVFAVKPGCCGRSSSAPPTIPTARRRSTATGSRWRTTSCWRPARTVAPWSIPAVPRSASSGIGKSFDQQRRFARAATPRAVRSSRWLTRLSTIPVSPAPRTGCARRSSPAASSPPSG